MLMLDEIWDAESPWYSMSVWTLSWLWSLLMWQLSHELVPD